MRYARLTQRDRMSMGTATATAPQMALFRHNRMPSSRDSTETRRIKDLAKNCGNNVSHEMHQLHTQCNINTRLHQASVPPSE